MPPVIYFAAPLFTMAEKIWNEKLFWAIKGKINVDIFLPQHEVIKTGAIDKNGNMDPGKVFETCLQGVDNCNIILAILDGADSDSGTCFECGYAFAKGKRIIGVRSDSRAGEVDGLNVMLSNTVDLIKYSGQKDNENNNMDNDNQITELAEIIITKINQALN